MNSITATIKREWLAKIINGTKRVEYRDYTDFWIAKLAKIDGLPLTIRLINGMKANAPEATVEVLQVLIDWHNLEFQFHLGNVVKVLHWEVRGGDEQENTGTQLTESFQEDSIAASRSPLKLKVSPAELSRFFAQPLVVTDWRM